MLRSATHTRAAIAAGRATRTAAVGAATVAVIVAALVAGMYMGLGIFYLYLWFAV